MKTTPTPNSVTTIPRSRPLTFARLTDIRPVGWINAEIKIAPIQYTIGMVTNTVKKVSFTHRLDGRRTILLHANDD